MTMKASALSLSSWISCLLLSGCAAPRNAQEFREGVRAGRGTSEIREKDFDRPFSAVFQSLKDYADRCYNRDVLRTQAVRYGPKQVHTRFDASARQTGKGSAEMVLQVNRAFWSVVDMKSISARKTHVVVYAFYERFFTEAFDWAGGKAHECPED
jgi:hypothetical protein